MIISADSIFYGAYKFQVLAALIVNLIGFTHGVSLGWVSPILSLLQSDSPNNPFERPITVEEASWIGSLLSLGGFVGSLIYGLIINRLGRKLTLLLLVVPNLCFWIIVYFANSVEYLYIGRICAGITGGGIYVVIPIFIAEIAENKIRGRLGSLFSVMLNSGIVIGFVLSSYLSYSMIPCLVIVLPLAYFTMMMFFPETPRQLLIQGHDDKAEESLKFYRNFTGYSKEDLKKFNDEFLELKTTIHATKTNENSVSFKDFLTPRSLKAIGIGLALVSLNQLCGIFAIMNYSSTIFASSGSKIDPNTNTIIIGIIQVFGTYTATLLIDKFGRKILMLISSGGMCLGLSASGVYSYLVLYGKYDLSHLSWVPLVTIGFVIFIGSIGVISVTFVVLVEILPPNIRATAATLCLMSLSLIAFGFLKVFPILLDQIQFYGVMWMCAGFCAMGLLFIAIFLPETKGKSLDAIEPSK